MHVETSCVAPVLLVVGWKAVSSNPPALIPNSFCSFSPLNFLGLGRLLLRAANSLAVRRETGAGAAASAALLACDVCCCWFAVAVSAGLGITAWCCCCSAAADGGVMPALFAVLGLSGNPSISLRALNHSKTTSLRKQVRRNTQHTHTNMLQRCCSQQQHLSLHG